MANIPFTKLEIPNGADNYVFDGITVDDLTELDLTQFPDKTQIDAFNENLKLEDYVKRAELTELDFDALIARLDNIVARVEAIEARVGI